MNRTHKYEVYVIFKSKTANIAIGILFNANDVWENKKIYN